MATKSIHQPDLVSLMTRLPGEIHRLLAESAARNRRSLNSEIVWALANYLGDEAKTNPMVQQMSAEQRQLMGHAFRALAKDPGRIVEIIAKLEAEPAPVKKKKT